MKHLSLFSISVYVLFLTLVERVFAQKTLNEIVVGKGSGWDVFLEAFGVSDPKKIKHPAEVIVAVLNIALGFLGLFMVCLLVYGGFLYMTAAGDEKKLRTAQDYIKNSIVGIFIILAAMTITWFVTSTFVSVIFGRNQQ